MKDIYELILQTFDAYDKTWIQRKRSIDTKTVFDYSLRTSIYKKGTDFLINEDYLDSGYTHFTPVAICKARQRLPEGSFYSLNKQIIDKHANISRVFAIDGSKIKVPAGFRNFGYKSRTNDKEVPRKARKSIAMLSALIDVNSKVCYDYAFTKHFNERLCVFEHLNNLKRGDTVILDRGYFSAELYNECKERGVHSIFRLKKDGFKYVKKFYHSPQTDKIVNVVIAKQLVKIRLIKYVIKNSVYILGTSLVDTPIASLQELYRKRWSVELSFRKLKSNLNLNYTFSLRRDTWFHNVQTRILADTISVILQSIDVTKFNRPTLKLISLSKIIRYKREKAFKDKRLHHISKRDSNLIWYRTQKTCCENGEISTVLAHLFVTQPLRVVSKVYSLKILVFLNLAVQNTAYSPK